MSEATSSASDVTINVKGPSELKLAITISPDKTVAELKAAIADKCDIEAGRQRLIYSGKVLKDEDAISSYKVASGNTIHMVKGAPKPAEAATAAAAPLPAMGTGLNVGGNILESAAAQHGLHGMNPFAGMGMNLNDPNAFNRMLDNPEVERQMTQVLSNPEMMDQILSMMPREQAAPMRAMLQNPMMRQMMSSPEFVQQMMQMQRAMRGGGGLGGAGGAPGAAAQQAAANDPFPNLFAPGATGAAGGADRGDGAGGAAGAPANPFANLFGAGAGGGLSPEDLQAAQARAQALLGGAGAGAAGAGAANPFANLFGGVGGAGDASAGGFNPFAFNPAMFGGGFGAPVAPADTRPPEEIYATQLGQLNAMGLWDAQKNITALRRTGGNVEAAIELIFSGTLDGPQ
ncbi:hypothetical protein Q5752_002876 [Cryptotrichosporon argae]